jgi:excisionase family DNA binding protein
MARNASAPVATLAEMRDLNDRQVAASVGVSVRTVQRWAANGDLTGAYKVGRRWRIPAESLTGAQEHSSRYVDPIRREIRKAEAVCRSVRRLVRMEPTPDRDWRAIAIDLRALELELDGLRAEVKSLGQ